jgi:hypothetical protein
VRPQRGYYVPPPPPPSPDTVPVKLADGNYVPLPGSRSTAVRVLALPAHFPGHRVYLGTSDILLHFDIAPMPGMNWRDVNGIRITRLIDSAGRPGASGTMKDPVRAFGGELFFGGGAMALRWDGDMPAHPTTYPNPRVVPVPIKVVTPAARSLKLLEGFVICEVAVPEQPLVTLDNIVQNAGKGAQGVGGAKMTVLDARPAEKGGKAVLKVQTDTPMLWTTPRPVMAPWGMIELSGLTRVNNQVKAYDAAGKAVRLSAITTSEFSNDDGTGTSMVFQFTCPDGLPTKLVLTGPRPVLVEVPFKMENVPLP